jgi:hypothetical protein
LESIVNSLLLKETFKSLIIFIFGFLSDHSLNQNQPSFLSVNQIKLDVSVFFLVYIMHSVLTIYFQCSNEKKNRVCILTSLIEIFMGELYLCQIISVVIVSLGPKPPIIIFWFKRILFRVPNVHFFFTQKICRLAQM